MAERHVSELVLDWVDQERQFRHALEKLPGGERLTSCLWVAFEDEKRQFLNEMSVGWMRLHRLMEIAKAVADSQQVQHGGNPRG